MRWGGARADGNDDDDGEDDGVLNLDGSNICLRLEKIEPLSMRVECGSLTKNEGGLVFVVLDQSSNF